MSTKKERPYIRKITGRAPRFKIYKIDEHDHRRQVTIRVVNRSAAEEAARIFLQSPPASILTTKF